MPRAKSIISMLAWATNFGDCCNTSEIEDDGELATLRRSLAEDESAVYLDTENCM